MGWKGFKKVNFYFQFCEKRSVPGCYAEIHSSRNTEAIKSDKTDGDFDPQVGTYVVEMFPSYFNFQVNDKFQRDFKKIFRVKGYCITLDQYDNVDQYLGAHFKPNFRTSMRRRLKGLESCFDVSYKMYYGQIVKDDYDVIMDGLHQMLIRRFDQRNDKNVSLARWQEYYDNTFALINAHKASLFVIYAGSKPIQISLSYHHDNMMFLSIPSYDIDYAKFGLGNISVQKLLEWCFANSYEMLDMGFGAFDYKVKWCNEIYDFEHHLFYDRSSIISRGLVLLIRLKTRLINFLLAKKVNIYYHRIKAIFQGEKKSDQLEYQVQKIDFDITALKDSQNSVNPMIDGSYAFLRKSVFDFLYTHREHIKNIQVYELERNKVYVVKGVKQAQKIIYGNN